MDHQSVLQVVEDAVDLEFTLDNLENIVDCLTSDTCLVERILRRNAVFYWNFPASLKSDSETFVAYIYGTDPKYSSSDSKNISRDQLEHKAVRDNIAVLNFIVSDKTIHHDPFKPRHPEVIATICRNAADPITTLRSIACDQDIKTYALAFAELEHKRRPSEFCNYWVYLREACLHLLEDKDFIYSLVSRCGCTDSRLMEIPHIIALSVRAGPDSYAYIPERWRNDIDFNCRLAVINPDILSLLPLNDVRKLHAVVLTMCPQEAFNDIVANSMAKEGISKAMWRAWRYLISS